jgi:hypothetical protein
MKRENLSEQTRSVLDQAEKNNGSIEIAVSLELDSIITESKGELTGFDEMLTREISSGYFPIESIMYEITGYGDSTIDFKLCADVPEEFLHRDEYFIEE